MSHGARNVIVHVIHFDLPLSRARWRSLARMLNLLALTHAWSRRAVAVAVAVAATDDTRDYARGKARSRPASLHARDIIACVVHISISSLPRVLVAALACVSSLSRARGRGARWGGGGGSGGSADW